MIKTDIIHPELLMALAETGHGARILLADSNYPVTTKAAPGARRVFLNFIPGIVGGVDIIRALAATIPVESAVYMANAEGKMPEIVGEYRKILGDGIPFAERERFAFYAEAAEDDTALVIASGEQRVYANLLITVGVRK